MENQDEGKLPSEFPDEEMEPTISQENPSKNNEPEKRKKRSGSLKMCRHCNQNFNSFGLCNHEKHCSAKVSTSNSDQEAQKKPCRHCKKSFNANGLPRHEKACEAKINSPAKSGDVSTPVGRFCPHCGKDFRRFGNNKDKRRHMELCEKYHDYVEKEGDEFKCHFCEKIIDTHGRCLYHIEQKHSKKAQRAKPKKVSPPKKKCNRIRTVPQKPDDRSSQICKTCNSDVGESLSIHENMCSRYFQYCKVEPVFVKGPNGIPRKIPRFDCKLCKREDKVQSFSKTCQLYQHIGEEHKMEMYKTSNENPIKRKKNHQMCLFCQKAIEIQRHANHIKLCEKICSLIQDTKCLVCDTAFYSIDQARDHVKVDHQVEAQLRGEEDPFQNVTNEEYDHETSMDTLGSDQTPKPRTPIYRSTPVEPPPQEILPHLTMPQLDDDISIVSEQEIIENGRPINVKTENPPSLLRQLMMMPRANLPVQVRVEYQPLIPPGSLQDPTAITKLHECPLCKSKFAYLDKVQEHIVNFHRLSLDNFRANDLVITDHAI